MTNPLAESFGLLARSLLELKVRLRDAVTAEFAIAVGEAARNAVALAFTGYPQAATARSDRGDLPHSINPWGDPDPWGDDAGFPDPEPVRHVPGQIDLLPAASMTSAALAAGLGAGRWWLTRCGSFPQALGLGLLTGLAALLGGPAVVATLSAAAGLAAASDALR